MDITPEELKASRKALGFNQEEIAAALGYKDSTIISLYESGKRPIASFLVYRWNQTFPLKLGQVVIPGKCPLKWKSVLQLPLPDNCTVRMDFSGTVTQPALRKLIEHLEMMMDAFPETL